MPCAPAACSPYVYGGRKTVPDAVLVLLCGLLNLRRCGCSIIARSTSRLGLSLECSSSLPPNPAQRSWLGTPVCFRLPARSKACGGLFVRACWVCGPWWRMSGVRVVSVSGSLPRAPNGRAETRVAQKACLAQCQQDARWLVALASTLWLWCCCRGPDLVWLVLVTRSRGSF